jgi:hypothetical protein
VLSLAGVGVEGDVPLFLLLVPAEVDERDLVVEPGPTSTMNGFSPFIVDPA